MLPQDAIFVQGDTVELQYQLFINKANNQYWDLTDHEIRFQLNTNPKIYKATANVINGADEQIQIINAVHGLFLITLTASETLAISLGDYNFTIQITIPSAGSGLEGKKYTVLRSSLRFVDDAITWNDEPV